MKRTSTELPNDEGQTMRDAADAPPCDGCDRMLSNVKVTGVSDRRRRFLDAYQQRPAVAPASRLAGVHRATVYRWLRDAAFADAMRAAVELYFREYRAKVLAEEAAQQRWRDERAQARQRTNRPFG